MKPGKDYVYVKKNTFGIVQMFLDEDCKNCYVNSAIYDDVLESMKDIPNEQIELYYI